MPRELGYILQSVLDVQAAWYVDDDGRLNLTKLLSAFRTFFREHSEHWLGRFSEYPEAGPQLILQAYLHRVVNGGGRIEREYGLGRGRTDLLVLWPREAGQPSDLWERFVVECKVLRDSDRKSLEWTVERGVEQTAGYMEKCGAEEGIRWCSTAAPARRSAGTERAGHRAEANTGRTAARCSSAPCRVLGNGCRPAPSSCVHRTGTARRHLVPVPRAHHRARQPRKLAGRVAPGPRPDPPLPLHQHAPCERVATPTGAWFYFSSLPFRQSILKVSPWWILVLPALADNRLVFSSTYVWVIWVFLNSLALI